VCPKINHEKDIWKEHSFIQATALFNSLIDIKSSIHVFKNTKLKIKHTWTQNDYKINLQNFINPQQQNSQISVLCLHETCMWEIRIPFKILPAKMQREEKI
jgi:hypothetical protein